MLLCPISLFTRVRQLLANRHRSSWAGLVAIILFVVAVDQGAKQWVLITLPYGEPQSVWPSFPTVLAWHHTHNTGVAFSLLASTPWLAKGLPLVLLGVLGYGLWRYQGVWTLSNRLVLASGLIMGGGIGNGLDRLRYGAVIDFIDVVFTRFPVFNVADIAITIGTLLGVWWILAGSPTDVAQPS